MPLDPSIILGYKPPQFPGVADVAQMKALQYRNALAGMQLQEAQREIQSQNALRQAMSAPGAIDPNTGMPSSQTMSNVMRIDPMAGIGLVQDTAKIDEYRQKALNDRIKGHLDSLGIAEKTQQLLQSQALNLQARYDSYIKSGATPQQASSLVTRDKFAWLDSTEQAGMISPQQAKAFRTPFDAQSNQAFIQYDPKYQGAQKTKADVDRADATVQHYQNMDSGQGVTLSDQALDFAAQRYNTTGNLPPVGIGKSGALMRSRIIERASELAAAKGENGVDVAGNQAGYRANSAALRQVTTYKNMVESFDETANKNADVLLGLVKKGAAGGTPVLNRWIQSGRSQIEGDPDVTAFNTAITTFVNEYSKIMSGATGAAGSTDSARKEASDLINNAMTPKQLNAAISTMRKDMKNRLDSLNEQQDKLNKTLRSSKQNDDGGQSEGSPAQKKQAPAGRQTAPQAALQYLKAHPELKSAFQAKYGYVPDGMQ